MKAQRIAVNLVSSRINVDLSRLPKNLGRYVAIFLSALGAGITLGFEIGDATSISEI
jgi:hypothetical protein